jgi:hypothetical protein
MMRVALSLVGLLGVGCILVFGGLIAESLLDRANSVAEVGACLTGAAAIGLILCVMIAWWIQ